MPGDTVPAVINGRLRRLTIVGVALSPEYVYSIRPGELVPDDRRFGIFWMDQRALAAAFDMEGGFNDVVAHAVARTRRADDVIARLDRLLEPYGGRGAIPRALQLSHWMVENELAQLQSFGFLLPLIFLMVAAFMLNVALTRALALQRPQIAALKALGYSNAALGWHYVKWALLIGAGGVVDRHRGGRLARQRDQRALQRVLPLSRAPVPRVPLASSLGATALTLVAAAAGAFSARPARRARAAGRGDAAGSRRPAIGRAASRRRGIARRLGTAGRMVLRNVARHPLRAAASIFGIGFAVAILMVGLVFIDAMERLITTQFWVAERQDVTVTSSSRGRPAPRHALARLPGVIAVEPQRAGRRAHSRRTIASGTWRSPACPRSRGCGGSSIATAARSGCRRPAWCCR